MLKKIHSKESIKERLNRKSQERLDSIPVYEGYEKPRVKAIDTWLVKLLKGENLQGKILGVVLSTALMFMPAPIRKLITNIRKQVRNSDMPQTTVKKFLKNVNTWEGVAALLAGFGIAVYPDLMAEIMVGVLGIYGAVKGWRGRNESATQEQDTQDVQK